MTREGLADTNNMEYFLLYRNLETALAIETKKQLETALAIQTWTAKPSTKLNIETIRNGFSHSNGRSPRNLET